MSKKTNFLLFFILLATPFSVYYALNFIMPYVREQPTITEPVSQKAPPPQRQKAAPEPQNHQPNEAAQVTTPEPAPLPEPEPQPEPISPEMLAGARYLLASYNYEGVFKLLAPFAEEPQAAALIAEAQKAQANLQEYKGEPVHIFFHSLVLDPAKAFKSPMSKGYNLWMTTRSEFEKMLPILLEKGFVLYPPGMMVAIDEEGNLTRRPIMLPAGKKPLVLSVDDINYYGYMDKDGFAKRLVAVPDGRVLTEEIHDGKPVLTDNGDVVPILEAFVAAHPEFSYHGYKGILAITGYEGAFGYRLNEFEQFARLQKPRDRAKLKKHTPEEEEAMAAQVRHLANQLRYNGWDIASHSFTHNSYFRTGKITLEQLKSEVDRFNARITPYVGRPLIFIPPFGMHLKASDPRYQYLRDAGYLFYMPVASAMKTELDGGMLIQNRLNLDGFTLLRKPENAAPVFTLEEVKQIVDPARPKMSL